MRDRRIAVVTGASSGIGEATVRLLAARGLSVVANGRRADRLGRLVDDVSESGGTAVAVPGDVTNDAVLDEVFEAAGMRWGRGPDVFVLCAGRGLPGTLLGSDQGQWRSLIELNYVSVLNQLRRCAELFTRVAALEPEPAVRDIVVVGSVAGRQVSGANPVYGSTKFAVHSIVEALRQEVCGHCVRTTLIEPGFVKSDFQRAAGYDAKWFRAIEDEFGPLLEPADIARTVEFVIEQPAHVHVDDIRIRPTRQRV